MTHALGCVGHKSSLAYPAARTTTHPGGAQLSEGARRSPAGRSTAVGDRRGSRRTPQFRVGVPDEALAVLWGRGDEPEEIAARFKITLAVVEEAIRLARPQIPEATKASSPPYLAFFKAAWAVAKMVKLPRSLGDARAGGPRTSGPHGYHGANAAIRFGARWQSAMSRASGLSRYLAMIAGRERDVIDDLFAITAVPGTEGRESKLHSPAINGGYVFKTWSRSSISGTRKSTNAVPNSRERASVRIRTRRSSARIVGAGG